MRARLRYSVVSPRAPRRYTGYLAGLVLAAVSVAVVMLSGMAATLVTHAAASALVAL